MHQRALLLVDLQNDFFPGGALPVSGAQAIFPLANDIQKKFSLIVASKDWHPENHGSFAANHKGKALFETIELQGLPQILWPNHCVQNTKGAEFHPKLNTERIDKIVYKGTDPNIDSYSAFFDNAHRKSTGLHDYLKEQAIEALYIMGLATDYCVLFSVLDALNLGYETFVIQDGCFGIEKNKNDVAKALKTMEEKGAMLILSKHL